MEKNRGNNAKQGCENRLLSSHPTYCFRSPKEERDHRAPSHLIKNKNPWLILGQRFHLHRRNVRVGQRKEGGVCLQSARGRMPFDGVWENLYRRPSGGRYPHFDEFSREQEAFFSQIQAGRKLVISR